jgi:periplasmic protein TonB
LPPHAKGLAGEVLVDFIIYPSGAVQNVFIAKASCRDFEKSALASVSQWKFKPGQINGRNVFTHMQVPIVYSLNEDEPKSKS